MAGKKKSLCGTDYRLLYIKKYDKCDTLLKRKKEKNCYLLYIIFVTFYTILLIVVD